MSVDIITPVWKTEQLGQAYTSLLAQDVSWRWLLQVDNPDAIIPSDIRDDERVSIEYNTRRCRTAVSRNQALLRSTAPYVFALDDDDTIYPNALAILIELLNTNPDCCGAWGQTWTTRDRGTTTRLFKGDGEERILPPGEILDVFEHEHQLIIHCGSMLWRRAPLVAMGGWMGLVHSEDTGLVLAASAIMPCVFTPTPVYQYHTGNANQETATTQFQSEQVVRHQLVIERARNLQTLLK